MMGSTEDPEDGKAVAGAVFGAVAVYGVRIIPFLSNTNTLLQQWQEADIGLITCIGLPDILFRASIPAHA